MISGTADRRVLTPSVRSRAGENGSDIITLELSAALDPNSYKTYLIEEHLYLYLKYMHADFEPLNMVDLM